MQASTAERLQRIQSLFDAGKSHAEIAKEIGYSKMTSYYRYICKYDNHLNYKKKFNKKPLVAVTSEETQVISKEEPKPPVKDNVSKAESIVSLIGGGLDVREVAKKKRFKDTQELANYMKAKGYIWSSSGKNYILVPQEKTVSSPETPVVKAEDDEPEQFGDVLRLLADNQDRLKDLLSAKVEKSVIPRYTLSGTSMSKTFNMVQPLTELIVEFSQEMNIHQKELLAVALIDFFRKYGYAEQVKYKLGL